MGYIIIFSRDIEELLHHVDEIVMKLGEAEVTLDLKKCRFFSNSIHYLGHIINPRRLEIYQTHTKSLRDAKPPTNRCAHVLFSVYATCTVALFQILRVSHPRSTKYCEKKRPIPSNSMKNNAPYAVHSSRKFVLRLFLLFRPSTYLTLSTPMHLPMALAVPCSRHMMTEHANTSDTSPDH